MPTIIIDNTPYEFEGGDRNLLEVCLSLGFNLPYFCWHPAMHSVGACRQCAVKQYKDEKDTRGKIVMSCITPATDGARISINDPDVVAFRASVIEWLMTNHPHDCPVCDEGGECHLQDMTVMTGHVYRRYRFKKRSYRNQDLGPFVTHEMNRCIQCYRCVRFYRDYAGGRDFNVFAIHDAVYFGREKDGVLENAFSGNLVEVCPTGVFTDKTLCKHYTRKWDLQTAPSLCVLCGLGCNTIPAERYETIRRIRNRYNYEVNGYFLCDRGRYGYEFINNEHRIRQPLLRTNADAYEQVTSEAAKQHLASLLGDGTTIGIGSSSASLESNYALKTLVGEDHFYQGVTEAQQRLITAMIGILNYGPVAAASLREIEHCDAVLILGEDVLNTAPRMALSLRQSVLQQPREAAKRLKIHAFDDRANREVIGSKKGPLFIATPGDTSLDELATATYRTAPDDLARLAFAVAHAINPQAPAVADLPEDAPALAKQIAAALQEANAPLVITGSACGSEALLQAAANVAWALRQKGKAARLSFIVPECNSMGAALLGGQPLEDAIHAVQAGGVDTLILLESDLNRHLDKADTEALLSGVKHLVVLASLPDEITAKAELILPAAAFAEADGTLVNNEGRAQRFYQVFVPEGEIQASWQWLNHLPASVGKAPWENWDKLVEAIAQAISLFEPILYLAPPAMYRIAGEKIARQPHRYSGRTAISANVTVVEPPPPDDPNTPMAFSMEGFYGHLPAPLMPRFWAPGWNSIQSLNKFQQEVGGPLTDGNAGRLLLQAREDTPVHYFTAIPTAFTPKIDRWLILPAYHIFGSEPLSMLTPGIAQRAPAPYLALSAEDAARLQLHEGEPMALALEDNALVLPLRIKPALPAGVAMLPVGLSGLEGIMLPAFGAIVPVGGEEERP